jgi:uncharacterized RDD family membrane protein YckC
VPNWYFVDGEQAAGPIDDATLRELALGGRIRPGSLVTPVGSNRWYTLSEFEERLALHRNVIGEYGHVPGESTIRFARLQVPPDRSSPRRVAPSSRRRAPAPTVRWGRRMLAALVDVVAFAAVTIAVGWLIGGFVVVHEPGRDSLRLGSRGLVLAGVLALLYFGVLVGTTGRSLGKVLFGVRLVDGDDGGPVGSSRGVMRFLLMVAMLAPCGVPLVIDALWPLGDRLHRTLHDKLLGTLAIRSRHAALSHAPVAHREVRGDVV